MLKLGIVLLGSFLLLFGIQSCSKDDPVSPLGPTERPSPLHPTQADSMDWEPDLGENLGFTEDDERVVRQIGFDFEFYGTLETSITIDSNGHLMFGSTERHLGPNLPFDHMPRMIAPWFVDLNPYMGGAIYANLLGEEPNRKLVVTWSQIPYWAPYCEGTSTFQVQLYEGSNRIQFGYNGLGHNGPCTASVGIGRDQNEYILTAQGAEGFALDMTNVCYEPDGEGGYAADEGSCSSCPSEAFFRGETFEGIKDLWTRSNPHSTPGVGGIRREKEQGAWIVDIGNDAFTLIESVRSGESCYRVPSINPPNLDPPPGGSVVAYIHTHPLPTSPDGTAYDCGEKSPTGGQILATILGTEPSGADQRIVQRYLNEYAFSGKWYVVAVDFGVYEYYRDGSTSVVKPFPGCIEGS